MTRKHIRVLLLALVVFASCVAVYFYNPETTLWMPKCIVYTLTGYKCPTCGATRAAHALMHGHIHEAYLLNPMMPILIALAAIIIYRITIGRKMSHKVTNKLVYLYIAIYCVWGISRNIFNL